MADKIDPKDQKQQNELDQFTSGDGAEGPNLDAEERQASDADSADESAIAAGNLSYSDPFSRNGIQVDGTPALSPDDQILAAQSLKSVDEPSDIGANIADDPATEAGSQLNADTQTSVIEPAVSASGAGVQGPQGFRRSNSQIINQENTTFDAPQINTVTPQDAPAPSTLDPDPVNPDSIDPNQTPQADRDTGTALEGAGETRFDVLANDSDVDGDALTLINAEVASGEGSVTIENGQVVFNPDDSHNSLAEGETADVTVSYTITDGNGETSTATLTITVTGSNDGPTV
uniref:Ig-like domain-containing protein n=2 Tax=Marinagarivorans algicola TaxID=1513270 RepID=UPI000B2D9231